MKKWGDKKSKRIRLTLLTIVLCLIPFSLNKYFSFHRLIPIVFEKVPEKPDESPEKPELIIKPLPRKVEPKQSERLIVPEKIPLPTTVYEVFNPLPSKEEVRIELHAMLEKSRTGLRVVKGFHIPPVEYQFDAKKLIIPVGLIAVGAVAHHSGNKDFFNISRPKKDVEQYRYDDYLQYMIAPSLFVLDAIGDEKHHPIDQFFVTTLAYGLTALQVRNLKGWIDTTRPDGGKNSFPSGHTAVASVGAHIIYKEFKDTNPWIAYSGYAALGAVAAGRVINNRHWLSDIVAGAGFGILSTELAYLMYFPVRNAITNQSNKIFGKYMIVTPIATPRGFGLQTNYYF